jgi:predicted AAA+ superfamily ATPase
MNVKEKNGLLLQGHVEARGLFPQIEALSAQRVVFEPEFGLDCLADEPGLIMVRGARQLGKSTWLESALKATVMQHGPGSAVYLNGDSLLNADALAHQLALYVPLLDGSRHTPRIFIDEITAVPAWERAIKTSYDSGLTRKVLIITTGSKAVDLRRGTERLPGRKGRLERSNYIYTPISYAQFQRRCRDKIEGNLVVAYMLTAGSPLAINALISEGQLPPYIFELVRDWILGECAAQGRSRNLLTWVCQQLLLRGGSPVPLNALARDSGAANNTTVRGYVELLADLLCLSESVPIDANSRRPLPRKPQKYHWINTLTALSFSSSGVRSTADFLALPQAEQGRWYEWLVAQELWRRAAIAGSAQPELQYHYQAAGHEIDFYLGDQHWLEVKRGAFNPLEFGWFAQTFPKDALTVICSERRTLNFARAITHEDFLCHGLAKRTQ